MKLTETSKIYEFLGSTYRITCTENPSLITLEKMVTKGWLTHTYEWEKIYFGHIDPLKEAVNFYGQSNKW